VIGRPNISPFHEPLSVPQTLRAVFSFYFIPSNLPSLRCLPDFVVGIPVAFEMFRFNFVIPSARFKLNDRPGIPVFVPFLAMIETAFLSHG
jgi:hypothetical protein